MSLQLISRNPDLKRLRDDGYDVQIHKGHLLVRQVPYVNASKDVKQGVLVSDLELAGDTTVRPSNHVIRFAGDYPCDKHGRPIEQMRHGSTLEQIDDGLVVQHSFSAKPQGGYEDYYHKMTNYAAILSGPAKALTPDATPRIYPLIESDGADSPFRYLDTASSRADITLVNEKLERQRVGIVGLGGTGSYILDLVAKTPVAEIHLFDGDVFSQHNAFRSPGAASIDELRNREHKVNYFSAIYSKMRRNIVAAAAHIDESNVGALRELDFVFLSLDAGASKKLIVHNLLEWNIPFIDVGMGVELVDGQLGGILRITTSTAEMPEHLKSKPRIPFTDGNDNNIYKRNIQIAELNALNGALAVVKWKKLFGFYRDLDHEYSCAYTIDGNLITNVDKA